jgi:putative endonuclease
MCHPERSGFSRGVEGSFVFMRKYATCMYIMQSVSRHVLYVGFCRDLVNRVWEHKTHALEGFTDDYEVTRLVYFEQYRLAPNAIAREKQVKRWRREKKEKLIASKNPSWVDLAADWFTPHEIAEEIRKNQNQRSLDSAAKAAPLGMTPSRVVKRATRDVNTTNAVAHPRGGDQ